MESKFWPDLINNYEQLLETGDGYDVIIYAGEEPNIKELRAHAVILRAQSPYFRTAFSASWAMKQEGFFIFKKPNISAFLFKLILRIDMDNLNGSDILKLLVAADELGLHKFIDHAQEYLIENQESYLRQDPIGILKTIFHHETFITLKMFLLEELCLEPELIFDSGNFYSLDAPILTTLLRRDDLNLEEAIIWEKLIKWCVSKSPDLSDDVSKWNTDDFATVQRSINDFLPLIRFHQMSSDDFFIRVLPYENLLPKDLVKDILRCHMVSGAKPLLNNFPARRNSQNLNNTRHGYVTNEAYAFHDSMSSGPCFGGGYDLGGGTDMINWYRNKHSYPDVGIPGNFSIEDIEVFAVMK
ncbi:8357_t:CDS:2 [Scutellospora calospora]|uniref:8357_t:CDS:1 n=1 Tax=Scutellospora calospora TaxID=85575 RepID=A0ACA9LYY2_9GLOM|nr:8357_t:CDS:2 [Scutellospora calospora]